MERKWTREELKNYLLETSLNLSEIRGLISGLIDNKLIQFNEDQKEILMDLESRIKSQDDRLFSVRSFI